MQPRHLAWLPWLSPTTTASPASPGRTPAPPTEAMMLLGRQVWFSLPPLRSLNCLPQARQRSGGSHGPSAPSALSLTPSHTKGLQLIDYLIRNSTGRLTVPQKTANQALARGLTNPNDRPTQG